MVSYKQKLVFISLSKYVYLWRVDDGPQIEACLNSRPRSMLPDDHGNPAPLTPGHFLVGEPLVIVLERNLEQSNISLLRRWQFIIIPKPTSIYE